MNDADRIEAIDYWWEGGFPGSFSADHRDRPLEPRVYTAIRRILLAMPDDDFDRFMAIKPQIVCQSVVDGTLFRYCIPLPPPALLLKPPQEIDITAWPHIEHGPGGHLEATMHVLFFSGPDFRKYSDAKIVRIVAHEVAHLLLGHVGGGAIGHGDIHAEEATDRKIESWGFKGAYSKVQRRQLAAQHERDKARQQQREKR